MELDYNLVREILEEVKAHDYFSGPKQVEADANSSKIEKLRAQHYKILIEEGLVNGKIDPWVDGIVINAQDLSIQGHAVLEGIHNNNLWNKMCSTAKLLGIEALKQIPGLAIKALVPGIESN